MPTRDLDFTGFVSSQDPRTFPTRDIRNLEAQGGNPNAITQESGNQSADVGNSILEVLRQYQRYGRSQEIAGQQEQVQRTFQTPSELIGANPNILSAVRNASVQAVSPQIGGARSLIEEAGNLIKDYQLQNEKVQQSAQNIIDTALSTGSAGLEELMRIQPDIFKQAGTNVKAYEGVLKGLKTKEIEDKRRFNVAHAPKITPTGGKLSPVAQAVIDGVIRLEDLTPTVRGQIAPELSAAGFKSGPKLSSGQQEDIATMDVLSQQISQLEGYAEGGLGGVGGLGVGTIKQSLFKTLGVGSAEGGQVRAIMGNLKGTLAKLRGGTSFTENEQRLLDTYVPGINESTPSILSKLTALKTFLASKKTSLVGAAQERGVPPTGQSGQTSGGLKFRILP